MTSQCTIVNYGSGNIFSVREALCRCGADPVVSSDRDEISRAERLILPGVGAFGRAAEWLRKTGLDDAVLRYLDRERPFLGICVGMQLLMDTGQEFGEHRGLGVFRGTVARIRAKDADDKDLRVPVIGWNTPKPAGVGGFAGTPFAAAPEGAAYYFVHSYAVQCENPEDVLAVCNVGTASVTAAIRRNHIYGLQFHPERSAEDGQALLGGFLRL